MKVAMIWHCYPEQLAYFYQQHPQCRQLSFAEQRQALLCHCPTWPSELSALLTEKGIETEFFVASASILQHQWALEHNLRVSSAWMREIILAQIKAYRPDVVWLSVSELYGDFVEELRRYCKKVITWVGSPYADYLDMRGISVLLTENPQTLKKYHAQFERVIVTKPGFNKKILDKIGPQQKRFGVSFVGSLSPQHSQRFEILSYLIQQDIPLALFIYMQYPNVSFHQFARWFGGAVLKERDVRKSMGVLKQYGRSLYYQHAIAEIQDINAGAVFGLDMYTILAQSLMTLNVHIDCAGANAGNMRMFEATGVGTCLLTERSANLGDLFEPGVDVVAFDSKEELVHKIRELLHDEERAKKIALAGQQRTLRDFSLEKMMHTIMPAFDC